MSNKFAIIRLLVAALLPLMCVSPSGCTDQQPGYAGANPMVSRPKAGYRFVFAFPLSCPATGRQATVAASLALRSQPSETISFLGPRSLGWGLVAAYCLRSAVEFANTGASRSEAHLSWQQLNGLPPGRCRWWLARKIRVDISYRPAAIRINGLAFQFFSNAGVHGGCAWVRLTQGNFPRWSRWLRQTVHAGQRVRRWLDVAATAAPLASQYRK